MFWFVPQNKFRLLTFQGKVNFVPVDLTTDDSNNYKDEAVSDDDRITASEKASPSSTESVDSAPSVEEPVKQ